MQINARSSIRWGTYGPWMIFGVFRGVTFVLSLTGVTAFNSANAFFQTPGGNILALVAAAISIGLYVHGFRLSQRGLVVKRVRSAEDILAKPGQQGSGEKPFGKGDANEEARPLVV